MEENKEMICMICGCKRPPDRVMPMTREEIAQPVQCVRCPQHPRSGMRKVACEDADVHVSVWTRLTQGLATLLGGDVLRWARARLPRRLVPHARRALLAGEVPEGALLAADTDLRLPSLLVPSHRLVSTHSPI